MFHLLSNRVPVQFLYKQNVVKNSFFSPDYLKLIALMFQNKKYAERKYTLSIL